MPILVTPYEMHRHKIFGRTYQIRLEAKEYEYLLRMKEILYNSIPIVRVNYRLNQHRLTQVSVSTPDAGSVYWSDSPYWLNIRYSDSRADKLPLPKVMWPATY